MTIPACDFIPDECAALLIQSCILAKKCKILQFELGKFEKRMGKAANLAVELRVKLNAHAECIKERVYAAFAAAGCPLPPIPEPPELPDIGHCVTSAVQGIKSEIEDPLGFLNQFVTIQFDGNFKPLRITTVT